MRDRESKRMRERERESEIVRDRETQRLKENERGERMREQERGRLKRVERVNKRESERGELVGTQFVIVECNQRDRHVCYRMLYGVQEVYNVAVRIFSQSQKV